MGEGQRGVIQKGPIGMYYFKYMVSLLFQPNLKFGRLKLQCYNVKIGATLFHVLVSNFVLLGTREINTHHLTGMKWKH